VGRLLFLLVYGRGRKRSRVVGNDSHFGVIKALLVENPAFEID
jgi:hypothetical protein